MFTNALNVYLDLEHSGANVGNAVAFSTQAYGGAAANGWNLEGAEIAMTRAAGNTAIQASVLGLVYTNMATTHASQGETVLRAGFSTREA